MTTEPTLLYSICLSCLKHKTECFSLQADKTTAIMIITTDIIVRG